LAPTIDADRSVAFASMGLAPLTRCDLRLEIGEPAGCYLSKREPR
jgi:hypothetical protein